MNVKLRMYKYCYSNLGAIYAKGLYYKADNLQYRGEENASVVLNDQIRIHSILFSLMYKCYGRPRPGKVLAFKVNKLEISCDWISISS